MAEAGDVADRKFPLRTWAGRAVLRMGLHLRGVTRVSCVLTVLFLGRVAIAQNDQATAAVTATPAAPGEPARTAPAPSESENAPAVPPNVSYVGSQLSIEARDSTLSDILTKVAALTGVKIDVPAGADSKRMPVVRLGPGPTRQILASLLSDWRCDYVIQASDTDPEKIQSVFIMLREKKGSEPNGTDGAARPSRSPYARAAEPPVRPEEAQVPDSSVPRPPENAAPEVNSAAIAPEQSTPPSPVQPDQSVRPSLLQPAQSGFTRPGALTPPQSMDSQSISQQLQQMYQQRMQMQRDQAPNSGNK